MNALQEAMKASVRDAIHWRVTQLPSGGFALLRQAPGLAESKVWETPLTGAHGILACKAECERRIKTENLARRGLLGYGRG